MNSKNRRTLAAIFEEPTRADIAWASVESLFRALGGIVEEGRGSRVRVALHDIAAVFHRPHPGREIKKGAVEGVREFLRNAGVTP